jgi:hypothetical protein
LFGQVFIDQIQQIGEGRKLRDGGDAAAAATGATSRIGARLGPTLILKGLTQISAVVERVESDDFVT